MALTLIPVLGILLILAGYIYFTFAIVNSREELKKLEVTRDLLKREITILQKTKDDLTAISMEGAQRRNDTLTVRKIREANALVNREIRDLKSEKRIYIQVNDRSTRMRMEELGLIDRLRRLGYQVFDFEIVEGIKENQIRYFHQEDADLAELLQRQLAEINPGLRMPFVFPRGYETRVPQGQFEIWIGRLPGPARLP